MREGSKPFIAPKAVRSGVVVVRRKFGCNMEGVGGQYCPDSDTFFRREYDAQPYLPYIALWIIICLT